MKAALPNADRLWELANAVCLGTLDANERHELEVLLTSDEQARRRYLAYCRMHAALTLEAQAQHAGQSASEMIGSVATRDTTESSVTRGPQPSNRAIVPPVVGFPANAIQGTLSYFSSGWPAAYLTSTVICGIGILILAFIPVHHYVQLARQTDQTPSAPAAGPSPLAPSSTKFPPMVGQVTGMVDCKWSDPQTEASNGASVPLGRKYALSSGLMQITYDTGAKVILQGPCTYEVESEAGGYLSVGKLTAKLEKRSEIRGQRSETSNQKSEIRNPKSPLSPLSSSLFTVKTPTATVTDLGTEFGVEVSKEGATTSHVFRGSVRVQVDATDGTAEGTAQILHENESVRVERNHGIDALMVSTPVKPADFVRAIARPTIKTLDLVDVVAGGDGFSGRRNAAIDPTNGETSDRPPENLTFASDGQYHRVPSLPLVDGVFIPQSAPSRVQLDSAGHHFDTFGNSESTTSDYVWAIGVLPSTPEFGPLRRVPYKVGEIDYGSVGHGALFLHANKGITFDLDAVRNANPGVRVRKFLATAGSTFAEESGLGVLGDVGVFVDGKVRLRRREINVHTGAIPIAIALRDDNRFLTLTATDCGSGIGGVWIVFGDPRIELLGEDRHVSESPKNGEHSNQVSVHGETESGYRGAR